ncbi:hypothetical protein WJX73_004051 [Symbiochloris irregularis]|uniref:N-acetyltransferase domain-containing protein n=1 Tax=Symbiochloris irregularis TaxID=706552 RepID=A0AAW1P3G4_9CHLO
MARTNSCPLLSETLLRLGRPSDLERTSVEGLYDQVGWPSGTAIANAWRGLQESQYVSILLTDEGGLAGLARATSDLAYNAQICDVVVLPDYQGAGYGRELIKLLICTLLEQKIENITVFADKEAVGFYETLGFERGVNRTK